MSLDTIYNEMIYNNKFIEKNNKDKINEDDIFKEGDEAILKFLKIVSNIKGFELYEYQVHLLNVITDMALPVFFYDIWLTYQSQIKKRYRVEKSYSIVASLSSRREGKTTFIMMMALCMALSSPKRKNGVFRQGIVSINFDHSKQVMKDIMNLYSLVPNEYKTTIVSVEKLATKITFTHKNGAVNIIQAYQSGEVRSNTKIKQQPKIYIFFSFNNILLIKYI